MRVSIVIPLHNEAPNADLLYRELREFAGEDHRVAEIIFVDDGSTDGTYERLDRACADDIRVTVLRLRRNFGQTAALSAGFDAATGDVICPMDGDLQNDPRDIPALLEKIDEGYDVVSGWRKDRKDTWLTRRVPSWLANRLISKITGVRLHDYGCTLKAYRREVLSRTSGSTARCTASSRRWRAGWACAWPRSRSTTARASPAGASTASRASFRVILDLINVKFLISYSTRPIQVFGKIGIASFFAGFVSLALTIYMKYFAAELHHHRQPVLHPVGALRPRRLPVHLHRPARRDSRSAPTTSSRKSRPMSSASVSRAARLPQVWHGRRQRMRVLFISYELPPIGGGGGRAALEIAGRLARRGHERGNPLLPFPGVARDGRARRRRDPPDPGPPAEPGRVHPARTALVHGAEHSRSGAARGGVFARRSPARSSASRAARRPGGCASGAASHTCFRCAAPTCPGLRSPPISACTR